MNKKSDLIKSTFIIALGKLSSQFAGFILLPIYTIFLSPEQFGMVDLIISYVVLLAPVIMVQLDRAAFRLLIEARGDDSRLKLVVSNTMRLILFAVVIAAILYALVNIFIVVPYAQLIALAIMASIFSILFLQLARGFGKNTKFAFASITTAIVNLVLSIVFVVVLGYGVKGVLWAAIASNIVAILYLFVSLKLHKFMSFSAEYSDRAMRRELITFAWPLVPSAVSWWFIRTFDRTLVTIMLGVAANGIYAASSKYALIFNALYSIFDLSWTESASAHINSRGRDKFFSDVYNTSFRFFASLGLMMIAITPFIFGIIIGDKFHEAYVYIPVLIIAALFNAAVSQYSVVYIAKKKTKQVLVTSIVAALMSVILNIILIPTVGILGAALSSAVAFFIMSIWRHFDIKKYVNVTFTGNIFVKLALAYALTVGLYYLGGVYINVANLILTTFIAFMLSKAMVIGGFRRILAKLNVIKIRR